jgi:hypothetical protein
LRQYRAFRRLEASNGKFKKEAWLEAWTEVDAAGFRYDIVKEGGSAYIADRVLRVPLEGEQAHWNGRLSGRSNLTPANYDCIAASLDVSGLMRVTVQPKRKDDLLIDGVIILTPDTGDLLRVEGRLANHRRSGLDALKRFERTIESTVCAFLFALNRSPKQK